ncbi:MAG: DUF192 domain-containing protein [archaeon]
MKQKNIKWFWKVGIVFLVVIFVFLVVDFFHHDDKFIEIGGKKIFVEVADSYAERQIGLMYRESLCENCGMLFIFEDEAVRSFWMKNTLIDLDIIFINSDFEVVDYVSMKPCEGEICESYLSKKLAKYVLEINGGKFGREIIGEKVLIRI